jgi:hypothetical protein
LRVVGRDAISKPAIDLIADGSVKVVDAVLEIDEAPVLLRSHLDAKGWVIDFSISDQLWRNRNATACHGASVAWRGEAGKSHRVRDR